MHDIKQDLISKRDGLVAKLSKIDESLGVLVKQKTWKFLSLNHKKYIALRQESNNLQLEIDSLNRRIANLDEAMSILNTARKSNQTGVSKIGSPKMQQVLTEFTHQPQTM